ncbi:hypothetical protein [Bosea sp. NBC_00550]|uniref:hypothetical protein n=1 Tax=Bosea sp. NBC_00550 TaxID=2969621 RepID=UPI002230C01C|nr:hypothetical protein [Bosea sp. NBC_00550]UZF92350.1 hypothetical protein NWE53_25390 [Bosea sp. NBC_00550]
MIKLLPIHVAALIGLGCFALTSSDAEAQYRRGIGVGYYGGYRGGYYGGYRGGYYGGYRGGYYGGRAVAAGIGFVAGALATAPAYGYGYATQPTYGYYGNGGYGTTSYRTIYSGSEYCQPATVTGYPQAVYYNTSAPTYYGGGGYYGRGYYGRGYYGRGYYGRPVVRHYAYQNRRAAIGRAAYYNNRPVVGHYGRRW